MSRRNVFESLGVASPEQVALVIAAHPDDEVIGMGAQLAISFQTTILHLTDGAPCNMVDARRLGFPSREDYAAARRKESLRALAEAGIGPDRIVEIGIADQTASYDMAAATRAVSRIIERLRPTVILTHPYEGGHPDHDAAAYATHFALRLLQRAHMRKPKTIEFASYHRRRAVIETFAFLPGFGTPQHTVVLSAAERELKRRMIAHYETQRQVLNSFALRLERFRVAPNYDFSRPPHSGKLYYEGFDWGISGADWRANARAATAALGIKGVG
jgi:LmbE family N-acetylglucosaminyl deacetylase